MVEITESAISTDLPGTTEVMVKTNTTDLVVADDLVTMETKSMKYNFTLGLHLKNYTYQLTFFRVADINDIIVAQNIWQFGAPIILILGTCLNLLSIYVLLRRKLLRRATPTVYLVVLAFVDLMVLYTGLLRNWLSWTHGYDVRLNSRASCKLHTMLVYFGVHFEAWTLVNLTVERLLAIYFPHASKRIITKTTVAIGLIATGLILLAINSHFLWTFDLNLTKAYGENFAYCGMQSGKPYTYFVLSVWPWVDLVLSCIAPFILMFLANIAIITRLVMAMYRRRRQLNVHMGESTKMTSMTAILFSVSFTFLVLTAPVGIYLSQLSTQGQVIFSVQQSAWHVMMYAIVNIMNYTNYSINFLLYCISGPRFRKELREMFCSTRVHPETSNNTNTTGINIYPARH